MDDERNETDWKPRVLAIQRHKDELWAWTYELEKAGRVTREDQRLVFKAYNDVVVRRGGSTRLEFDAVNFALMRDGLHQSRTKLLQLRPELQQEVDQRLPRGLEF